MNELVLEALRVLLLKTTCRNASEFEEITELMGRIDAMLAVIRQDREAAVSREPGSGE